MTLTATIDREAINKSGGGRCFGPRFTNVLQAVQQFAALGNVIIGGSQNIIACGVRTLVRMCLLSLVNYSSYMDKLSTLLMVAGRSAPRYQKMALLYTRSRMLQSSLSEYFIVIVRLCHHMLKTAKRTRIGQMISSLSDSDIRGYETDLLRLATAIKEEADLLLNENIDDQGVRVKLLLKLSESEAYRRKFKIRHQILDSCSKYDYETTWKELRKAGNSGLLGATSQYSSWKPELVSSTLWWRGKLGSGKSVLMADIVDDLNLHVVSSQVPVAYFFCRHDIAESLKARTILGPLARQLLRSVTFLPEKDTIDETMPSFDCDRILFLLRRTLPSSFRTLSVLDGLDECAEQERISILEHIRALQRMFGLLVCLSCRVDASSTPWLIPSMMVNSSMATIPDDNPDIACFIRSELEHSIEAGALKVGDPAIVLEIEDALSSISKVTIWRYIPDILLPGIEKDLRDIIISRCAVPGSFDCQEFPLLLAITTGDSGLIDILYATGQKMYNLDGANDLNAMDYAIFKVLLCKGAKQHSFNTVVSSWPAAKVEKLVEYIKKYGQEWLLEHTGEDGLALTPLRLAIRQHQLFGVEVLLRAGANVNCPDGIKEPSPLMDAVVTGDVRITKLLIESGADVNFRDFWDRMPLSLAVTRGDSGIFDSLFGSWTPPTDFDQTKLNRFDKEGHTPLLTAIRFRNVDIVSRLLKLGASPNIVDLSGRTPLWHALGAGVPDVVKLLLEYGANPNFETQPYLLEKAILIGLLEDVQQFVAHGALQSPIVAHHGMDASQFALEQGEKEISLFLEAEMTF